MIKKDRKKKKEKEESERGYSFLLHFSCTSCVSFSETEKKEKVTQSKKWVTPP